MYALQTLTVQTADEGLRLDNYLVTALAAATTAAELDAAAHSPDSPYARPSRAQVQAWIEAGCVKVAGQLGRASRKVRVGEEVEVTPPALREANASAVAMDLDVLYEDEALLVLNKTAHLSVHPGAGAGEQKPTLVHGLLAHCKDLSGIGGVVRPGIVHRLDRGTTGTLVVAKSDLAHRHLAAQFAARTVHKRYLALVHAPRLRWPNGEHAGRIDTPYGRHRSDRKRFSGRYIAEGPQRRAVTEWSLVAQDEASGLALVSCKLHTGRTHQIRVHLAELGFPIVGDALYGARRSPAKAPLWPELAQLDHQALHAWRISFEHPLTGASLTFAAPLPPSWREAARKLLSGASQGDAPFPLEVPCA